MTADASVRVRAGGGDYRVRIEPGLLERLPTALVEAVPSVVRWAVVSDDRVAPLWAEPLRARIEASGTAASLHTFPAGETHKTREQWLRLSDELVEVGLGRDGGVVAVGGGVTGDLAGFVAATHLRGVPVVQVPTSVVAMVDSSVGGKTGVDTPAGKNLVGAFHPPRLVAADPTTIATLPRPERAQGWAEAVKHGAILDREYLERLVDEADALLDGEVGAVGRAVLDSVRIKARVVGEDEREAGLREVLNFGHTLGHALESLSAYRLPHGSAVSIGMVLEARLGEWLGVTEDGTAERIEEALRRFALPTTPVQPVAARSLVEALVRDKKVRRGTPRVVLLERPGSVARQDGWARPVEPARILEWATSSGTGLVTDG